MCFIFAKRPATNIIITQAVSVELVEHKHMTKQNRIFPRETVDQNKVNITKYFLYFHNIF